MASEKPWKLQWHIASDGTVIQQRSKSDDPNQQLYGRHKATRVVEIADLDRMQERFATTSGRWDLATRILLYASYVLIAALLVGIVLLFVGVDGAIWIPLMIISAVLLVAVGASTGILTSRLRHAFDPIRADAGLDPNGDWETIAASEARAALDEPGAVSGRIFRVEHA